MALLLGVDVDTAVSLDCSMALGAEFVNCFFPFFVGARSGAFMSGSANYAAANA